MKKTKLLWMAVALGALTACEKSIDTTVIDEDALKDVRFAVEGDWQTPTFTRTLTADGKDMTDMWVLDYMGGTLVQQLHQASTDEDFGQPAMALKHGEHHIYFIASRGTTPTLSTANHTITWATTSDTFYKDLALTVNGQTAAAQAVTLNRAATRLNVTINDALPEGLASVTITPATWYYGIDYLTGNAADGQEQPREISIPQALIGQTGKQLSIFGLSGTTEWTTNISVVARDGDDNILAQTTISNAPFKANRATTYSGNLFSLGSTFTVSLSATWDDMYNGNY